MIANPAHNKPSVKPSPGHGEKPVGAEKTMFAEAWVQSVEPDKPAEPNYESITAYNEHTNGAEQPSQPKVGDVVTFKRSDSDIDFKVTGFKNGKPKIRPM